MEPVLALEQRQAFAIREAKKTVTFFLSVTVYDRQVSELRWTDEAGSHCAFSNIDFNYIAGMDGFETPDAIYTLMMGIGNATRAERIEYNRSRSQGDLRKEPQRPVPPLIAEFSVVQSEYIVVEDEASPPDAFAPLDALHIYFDANKSRLMDEYSTREAANAERQRWLKAHPPIPKDIVINYWREPNQQPSRKGTE